MTLSVQSYHDTKGFEALTGEWNALLHRSPADTIFLTLEYQRTWWRNLGEGELLILAVRDDGKLVGIAPLFATEDAQGQRVLTTVGCVEVSDYLDLIVAREREGEVYGALVDYLAGPGAPAWDALDLCNIHQDSPTLELLPALAETRGWAIETARDDVCPIVQLPATWDEYLQMLSKKQRHEVRRKMRRLEAQVETNWYIVGPEHDLQTETEDFLDLMAASTPGKAEFLTPRMRNFFRQLTPVAYDAGWLQLAFLKVGGQKAAAYLNFIYDNRVLVYNSGLDWRTFPKLGAGIVLTAYCIRHAIERGREAFDFMQGDERYKYQFGGQDIEVQRLVIRRT
ncbi:MAG TPA: GNAT family N-acetyltransferase [Thermoflexia bacterium]|nr:GNAT family N-acetyltransferase [Thermoflexia bacterium]